MDVQLNAIKKYFDSTMIIDVDYLHLKTGNIYCLMGRNGAGKTTLLKMIAGLDPVFDGEIKFLFRGLAYSRAQEYLTMVSQSPYIFNTSVWNNVAYGLRARRTSLYKMKTMVNKYLEMMDLKEVSLKNALTLSGGQMQRVALARAMAFEPALLLLDEPMSNVDDEYKEIMNDAIRKMNQEKKTTVIMVTHDIKQLHEINGHLLIMNQGKIKAVYQDKKQFDGIGINVKSK